MLLSASPGRSAAAIVCFALVAAGCDDDPVSCGGFIGDPDSPPEAELIALADGQIVDVASGGSLSLERPPQGGYVVYAAARARNVSACNVDLAGQLRDSSTGSILGFDRRQSNFAIGVDGWGRPSAPEASNFPNVNPCPDNSPNDVQGRELTLEMKLTDREGRTVSLSAPVIPRCELADPGTQLNCVCTCSANYFLGKCGFGDGGGDGDLGSL